MCLYLRGAIFKHRCGYRLDNTILQDECLLRCRELYFRVDRRRISFLRFIFESYDGIGTITTIDPHSGIILIRTAPGCESEVDSLIDSLKHQVRMEPVPRPALA